MLRKSPEHQMDLTTPITANYDEIKQIISHVWDDTKVKACSTETNNSNDSHECSIMQPGESSESEIQSCFTLSLLLPRKLPFCFCFLQTINVTIKVVYIITQMYLTLGKKWSAAQTTRLKPDKYSERMFSATLDGRAEVKMLQKQVNFISFCMNCQSYLVSVCGLFHMQVGFVPRPHWERTSWEFILHLQSLLPVSWD